MELSKEQAMLFTETIVRLDAAKMQFEYCKENQIMNGHPIRVMEECKIKLQNLVHFKIPDVSEYPEIHDYMKSMAPCLKKIDKHENSLEEKQAKQRQEIEHLRNMIASMEQSEQYYISQMKHYEWKAKKCVSDSNSLKTKLFELQFADLELSPPSAVSNLVV